MILDLLFTIGGIAFVVFLAAFAFLFTYTLRNVPLQEMQAHRYTDNLDKCRPVEKFLVILTKVAAYVVLATLPVALIWSCIIDWQLFPISGQEWGN